MREKLYKLEITEEYSIDRKQLFIERIFKSSSGIPTENEKKKERQYNTKQWERRGRGKTQIKESGGSDIWWR